MEYKTDKKGYLSNYEIYFSNLKDQEVKLLELGILEAGSLFYWRDYFKKGEIVGLDINEINIKDNARIKTYVGDQKNVSLLEKITKENTKEGFDIIIDDASHFGHETFVSFTYLFKNALKPGGIYVIEDWGTGYWPHYPDGKSFKFDNNHISSYFHKTFKTKTRRIKSFPNFSNGMVGVIKQLVDEVAIGDATNSEYTKYHEIGSTIEKVIISKGITFIFRV